MLVRLRDISPIQQKSGSRNTRKGTNVTPVLVCVIRDLSVTPAKKLDYEIHEEPKDTMASFVLVRVIRDLSLPQQKSWITKYTKRHEGVVSAGSCDS